MYKYNNKFEISAFTSLFLIILSFQISAKDLVFKQNLNDTIKVIEPKEYHQLENQLITSILTRYHYRSFDINDSLSEVIFKRYFETLDQSKYYFLNEDIESFKSNKNKLDDFLLNGDVNFYYDVFNVYLKRLNERLEFADLLLQKEFDYSADENFYYDRDKAKWAKSKEELDDLWRRRLKNDALTYKLNGKDWEFIQKTLRNRYKNFANFLNQYNSEDVFQLAMNSFTEAIDPHTNYLSPETSDNFKIDMSLSLEGIGARLQTDGDYTKVVEVIPGGPAYKSKLINVDDKIIGVAQGDNNEFEDVIGWRITDVVKLIRGEKGTKVRLQIIPAGSDLNVQPKEIALIREKVKLEDQAAKSEILEINNDGKSYKIGVIKIPKFYNDFDGRRNGDGNFKSTTKDVKAILDTLIRNSVDGVVIDLREDGGGSLQEAIELTGLFIKDGPIVQVKNSDGTIEVADDPDTSIIYNGPMAVLVNRFSASASEIFAGAIQDYGRGLIIGEQTYGKGTVQNLIDLNRLTSKRGDKLGQVKLTIAKYYRVNGGSTQNLGVIPDVKFPSYVDPSEFGESSQPSALPWDEIQPSKFKRFSDLSKILPKINEKHIQRISNNSDFNTLLSDIETYKQNKNKTFISLNEEIRRKEKEAEDQKKLDNNLSSESANIELIDDEVITNTGAKKTDYFLKEAAFIVTDLILLTIG
jgi:carboxyl-terminal processing protease